MAIIAYDPTAKTSYWLEYSDMAGREQAAKSGLQLSTGDTSGLNPYQYKRVDDTPNTTDTSKLYGSDTSSAIDEAAIRKAEEERIAQQIKAIEGVYAGEIAKAKKQGAERVGQKTAMSTVRGGAGSDFAQTAKTNIEDENTQAEQAKLAQMNAEIAAARAQGGSNERAAIQAAYQNAASKKALADADIEAEKTKFSDAKTIASTAAQSGVPYANLDAATREILSKYYGTGAEAVYKKLGEQEKKTFTAVSPGSSIYDNSGKLIGTAPSAPADITKPITQEVGNTLLQWNPATNSWSSIYTSPETTSQKIVKIDGVDYVQNADGTYTKPTVPTAPTTDKISKAEAIVTKINNLLATDDWKAGVGPVSSQLPEWASGKRNTALANIEEIISSLALENLNLLKGPMSDKDIQFIKDASAGLRSSMDEASFKKKLESIKAKMEEVKKKAETYTDSSASDSW